MFDDLMQKQWGNTLRTLRENGDTMLHAACANLQLVDFTEDTIEVTCRDDATFNLLTKHRAKLGSNVNIHKYKPSALMNKNEIIEKLEEIFGDKLAVKK